MEQEMFLKQLALLVDYARTKDNKLGEEEVREYFSEMNLTEEQLKLVYEYLTEHHVDIKGVFVKKGEKPMSREDSAYLRIYRKEINALPIRTKEEMEEIYRLLSEGDESILQKAIESHLKRIVTIAAKYKNRGVLLEDLIQEGNLELISSIHEILGDETINNPRKEIERRVKSRLIELVDEALEATGREHSILAKTNLIYEATKVLAEELGTVANIHELAEYTKMTEDEIMELVDLSLEEIKIGECGHNHHEETNV